MADNAPIQVGNYSPFTASEMNDPFWWRKRRLFGGANPLSTAAFGGYPGGGGGSGSGGSGFSGGAAGNGGGAAPAALSASALSTRPDDTETLWLLTPEEQQQREMAVAGGGGDASAGGPGSAPDTGVNDNPTAQDLADIATMALAVATMPNPLSIATIAQTIANNTVPKTMTNRAITQALAALGMPNPQGMTGTQSAGLGIGVGNTGSMADDANPTGVDSMGHVGVADSMGFSGGVGAPGPSTGATGSVSSGTASESSVDAAASAAASGSSGGGAAGSGASGGGSGGGASAGDASGPGGSGQGEGAGGAGGGAGSGSGGCHVYTELLRQGLVKPRDLAAIILYHKRLQRPQEYAGYVRWSLPTSRLMRRSPGFSRLVALPLAQAYLARKKWRLGIVKKEPRGALVEWIWDGINRLCGLRADAVPEGKAGECLR